VNEILTLTPGDYKEQEVNFLEPTWALDVIGVHTLNFAQNLSVADALIRRPRTK
jgi:hypothetical protein